MASRCPSLFCLYFCWMLSIHVHRASAVSFDLNFSEPSPNVENDIICKGDASISSSALEVTKNRRDSTSRALYAQKLLLWNRATGEMASFTTNFSFRISMDSSTNPTAGDGLAFFLGASPEIPDNSTGGSLGLLTYTGRHRVPMMNATVDQHIVAVEFDTFRNPELNDSSGNHIGIDLNSLNSTAYVDTTSPIHNLTSGSLMIATVNYDNRTKLLAVHLQIGNSSYYHVNSTVDLSSILPEEVNVGFSAATGAGGEEHQILSWSFNSTLEQTKQHPNGVRVRLYVIIPGMLFLLVCAAVSVGFLVRRRRMVRKSSVTDSEEEEEDVDRAELERGVTAGGPRRYTYRVLAAATSNFAEEEKLGRGGFGGVYRGHLTAGDQDRAVAIKVLSANSSAQGRNEFEAEVRIISRVKHRCLVQLLGWCDSRKGLLLVYELVAQGSLDRHLYNNERLLTWPERHEIILGLGSALRYLHGEWEQCVVHGDIKPSNIMLDSSYRTKLGDFGLAKLVDHGTRWQTTNKVQGTTGYIDPEFVNTGRPSTESDVYSFGIVLLEVVSGRRPVVETADGIFTLLRWVWNLYGGNAILDAVDERLSLSGDEQQMQRALVIGLWCAHPDRSERPSIAQAMYVLQTGDARLPTLPPRMYTAVLDGLMLIDGITQSSATTANTINSFSTASPNSFSTALLGSQDTLLSSRLVEI